MNTRKIKKYVLNARYALNLRKPLLTYRIFKAYVNHLLGRMPLRYIDLAITYNCNLDCKHCSAMTLKSAKRQMKLDDYEGT